MKIYIYYRWGNRGQAIAKELISSGFIKAKYITRTRRDITLLEAQPGA